MYTALQSQFVYPIKKSERNLVPFSMTTIVQGLQQRLFQCNNFAFMSRNMKEIITYIEQDPTQRYSMLTRDNVKPQMNKGQWKIQLCAVHTHLSQIRSLKARQKTHFIYIAHFLQQGISVCLKDIGNSVIEENIHF